MTSGTHIERVAKLMFECHRNDMGEDWYRKNETWESLSDLGKKSFYMLANVAVEAMGEESVKRAEKPVLGETGNSSSANIEGDRLLVIQAMQANPLFSNVDKYTIGMISRMAVNGYREIIKARQINEEEELRWVWAGEIGEKPSIYDLREELGLLQGEELL